MSIRRWHAYLGLLIAPSVLFFSLTGAVQLFNLHEAHGSYRPSPLIEKLSSVHKDQVFEPGHHGPPAAEAVDGPPPAGASPGPGPHQEDDKAELPTTLLKSYFLVVALALALSTAFGIWMGITQIRAPRLAWTLLIMGTVLPIGLLLA